MVFQCVNTRFIDYLEALFDFSALVARREEEIDLECVNFLRACDPLMAQENLKRFKEQIAEGRIHGPKSPYLMRMIKNAVKRCCIGFSVCALLAGRLSCA